MTPQHPADAPAAPRALVVAALLAVYFIWGSTYLALRVVLTELPPLLSAGIRHLSAGTVLLLFARARGTRLPTAVQWRNSMVIGVLLQGMGNGGVVWAQQTVSSGVVSTMVAIMPLWAALWAGIWGTWPSRRDAVALALGAAGVVVLGLKGELQGQPFSLFLLIMSSAAWGLGSVWGRHVSLPAGAMASAAQMLCGGVVVTALALLRGEHPPTGPVGTGPILAWLYLAVAGSLVAYSAYVFLLRNVRPALATSYAYVNPVVALFLGVTLGGEQLDAWSLAGGGMVLGGVVILLVKGK